MSDLRAIAVRVEIEALRGELTEAVMMRDYDRAASLFTHNGAVRVPHINAEAVGREALRTGAERQQALRYQRTGDGWKFAERVYEVRYLDRTPLAPHAAGSARLPAPAPRRPGLGGRRSRNVTGGCPSGGAASR